MRARKLAELWEARRAHGGDKCVAQQVRDDDFSGGAPPAKRMRALGASPVAHEQPGALPQPPGVARCDGCGEEATCFVRGLMLCPTLFGREKRATEQRRRDPRAFDAKQREEREAAAAAAPLTWEQLQAAAAAEESSESSDCGKWGGGNVDGAATKRDHVHSAARKALRLHFNLRFNAKAVTKQLTRVALSRNRSAIDALAKMLPKHAFGQPAMRTCRRCSLVVLDDPRCTPRCRLGHNFFRLSSAAVHGMCQYRCWNCRGTWSGDEYAVTESDLGPCKEVPHVFSDDDEEEEDEDEEEEERDDDDEEEEEDSDEVES